MPNGSGSRACLDLQLPATGPPLRIVGIGASAGAVEAFTRLLKGLPTDSGMAFVLLSHLSPTHHSELARLFSPLTSMPVQDARDRVPIEANHVYVLPPNRILRVEHGQLRLAARDPSDVLPRAVDRFLISLALELGPLAVGVVLSGTGTDGTAGMQAIRNHGGVTFAQDPSEAAFDGMPRSAVESGGVDHVLPLEQIASAITGLGYPAAASAPPEPDSGADGDESGDPALPVSADEASAVEEIIRILHTATGVDFLHYKRASLVRRIRRRAETTGFPDLRDYLARLQQDPAEASALFQVVLIQVTRFFREPAVFAALRSTIIPALAPQRVGGESVRAWVIGAATGEEAYSLAIAFAEVEAQLGVEIPVRVFATDVNDAGLLEARHGKYPEGIEANLSKEELTRFFAPVSDGYQVSRRLRELCVFARHDATCDPPFPQIDLVLCCNVLIYLDPVLQRKVLQNIHYALKPGGYLVLGPAETVTGVEGLFTPFDREHQIYLRRPGPARLQVARDTVRPPRTAEGGSEGSSGAASANPPRSHWSSAEILRAAERAYFAHQPSASVIVNQDFEVLHYHGLTGAFLEAPTGGPTTQLLRLAHPDLQLILGRTLRRVKKGHQPVRQQGAVIGKGKGARRLNLSVIPVPIDGIEERHFLVVFEEAPQGETGTGRKKVVGAPGRSELEAELAESREFLQAFIDQQDTTNAEVQAAYEASLSVNEEYQSTNEELESAKEELQSLNEELTTINEQMQQRNSELLARSAEVTGLLEALDMPLLLLTRDLRLRAYNSRAAADFHLAPANIGLALGRAMFPLIQVDLGTLVEGAFADGKVKELELQDRLGCWRALRVWPIDQVEDGGTVAVAFVDIHKLKTNVAEARDARFYSEAVVETILDPLVVMDETGRMLKANRAFHRTFGTDAASLESLSIGELGGEDWDPAVIDGFLARAAQASSPVEGPEILLVSRRLGRRVFQLGAGMITWQGPQRILLALKDITARKLAEESAIQTSRMQAIGQLAGGVAHEINNQMTVVIGLAGFLLREAPPGTGRDDTVHILKAAERSALISQQLLAFSRRQMLQPVKFDLNALIAMARLHLRPFLRPDIALDIVLGDQVGQVNADLGQMEQLLVSLVMNARDAIEGAGQIRIETTTVNAAGFSATDPDTAVAPRGTYARLIVTDSGHGMDPATKARVFEPFFTTKGIGEGTGLGLASVYGVVKQSGGLIWVESELGRGTTFTIDFPQVASSASPVKTPSEPSDLIKGSGTILVVDDQEGVRSLTARTLRDIGYATMEARDGSEAIRLIVDGRTVFTLVVSDVSMPGMDGVELKGRMAELCPELPIVLMSGFARDDTALMGRVDADTPLLLKPFTTATLAARVKEAVTAAAAT